MRHYHCVDRRLHLPFDQSSAIVTPCRSHLVHTTYPTSHTNSSTPTFHTKLITRFPQVGRVGSLRVTYAVHDRLAKWAVLDRV